MDRWYLAQRMQFIENALEVFGFINRGHLRRKFGLSDAQAALDLREFQKRKPNLIRYDPKQKAFVSRKHKKDQHMRVGKSHRHNELHCLGCDRLLNGAAGLLHDDQGDTAPADGDATMCAHCQHIMIFRRNNNHLKFREPTPDELAQIKRDLRVSGVKSVLCRSSEE